MRQQTKYREAFNRLSKKRVDVKAKGKCICEICETEHDCPKDCKWHPWNGDICLCSGCYFAMPESVKEKLNKVDAEMYYIGNELLAYKVQIMSLQKEKMESELQ